MNETERYRIKHFQKSVVALVAHKTYCYSKTLSFISYSVLTGLFTQKLNPFQLFSLIISMVTVCTNSIGLAYSMWRNETVIVANNKNELSIVIAAGIYAFRVEMDALRMEPETRRLQLELLTVLTSDTPIILTFQWISSLNKNRPKGSSDKVGGVFSVYFTVPSTTLSNPPTQQLQTGKSQRTRPDACYRSNKNSFMNIVARYLFQQNYTQNETFFLCYSGVVVVQTRQSTDFLMLYYVWCTVPVHISHIRLFSIITVWLKRKKNMKIEVSSPGVFYDKINM